MGALLQNASVSGRAELLLQPGGCEPPLFPLCTHLCYVLEHNTVIKHPVAILCSACIRGRGCTGAGDGSCRDTGLLSPRAGWFCHPHSAAGGCTEQAGLAVPLLLCQPCTRLLLGTGSELLLKVVARCRSLAAPSSTAAASRPVVLPGPGTQLCCSATVGAAAPAPAWAVAGVPARVGAAGGERAVRHSSMGFPGSGAWNCAVSAFVRS